MRTDSGDSLERKVIQMENKIKDRQQNLREVNDEGFTNYTDLNLTLMKRQKAAKNESFSDDLLQKMNAVSQRDALPKNDEAQLQRQSIPTQHSDIEEQK